GGGRYDGLAEGLGGRQTPGIGFGSGIERIILNYKEAHPEGLAPLPAEVFVVAVGTEAREKATELAGALRGAGIRVGSTYGERSFGAQMKAAGNSGARLTLILGADELAAGQASLKDMANGEQRAAPLNHLVPEVQAFLFGRG
ncbi:MAG TPA: His/Gly/Thr/Pro-type tRNA ligase C-terminal domain-containing protein, partial [Chloroflexota bacterium]|nr:His/Gly/Thr/Pro-type tRNA ligase C-terminal domain-containing protein [Chloroflexota bacterium]